MKKTYESPSIEKIAFAYRDQVVVASNNIPGTSCTQNWTGDKESNTTGCGYTVAVPDSGF